MTQHSDGGPAFPHGKYMKHKVTGAFDTYAHGGMSLRDYAAIHANLDGVQFNNIESMASFVGAPVPADMDALFQVSASAIAKVRYIFADAMLAARQREGV